MSEDKDLAEKPTLIDRAKARKEVSAKAARGRRLEGATMIALILSGILTVIYLSIAIYFALIAWGWHPIVAMSVGIFIGCIAVIPGEFAINLWQTRLQTDKEITGTQANIARLAGFVAVIASGVATVSFFAFILENFSPGWYDNELAATVNLVSVGVSWLVLLAALFAYQAFSVRSKQNRKMAEARNDMADANVDLITALAQARREATDAMLAKLEDAGVFLDDALVTVGQQMKITDGKRREIEDGLQRKNGKVKNQVDDDGMGFPHSIVPTDEQIADFLRRHPQYRK